MLSDHIRDNADRWLNVEAPRNHIALSTRARYARNLAEFRFAPHAPSETLVTVLETVRSAAARIPALTDYQFLAMEPLESAERTFLRESRVISPDMEKATLGRGVFVSQDFQLSIMVNEEDHLRIQSVCAGMQLHEVFRRLDEIEQALGENLAFAFSEKLGHLTACPTNTGTGLRVSVMLHLPALTLLRRVEEILQGIAPFGLTVRGFYGENTEFQGDFFQISNEITLGKSEEEICRILERVVDQIVTLEEECRKELLDNRRILAEDVFWRSYALLCNARLMNTQEAMRLLSRVRLGIEGNMLGHLTHTDLNRLVVDSQPAHVQFHYGEGGEPADELRDQLRARLLRERLMTSGN